MKQEKIGLGMISLIGVAMAITGVLKIVGAEEAAKGFGNDMAPYILAVIEFIIAALITIPKRRLLGIILAASYIGGIIAFSWLHEGELPIVGVVLNIILYVGTVLYRPSLMNNSIENSPV